MIRSLAALFAILSAAPAHALVGGATPQPDGIGRAVVTVVGSRGNFCSGALIAPDLVLTAAHCVPLGADYKIVDYDAKPQPQLRDLRRVALHPQYDARGIAAHRASADIALLQLAAPLRGRPVLSTAAPVEPIAPGQEFWVLGAGVTVRGDGSSGGKVRAAALVSTSQPGRLQIRLVDPATNNHRPGLGACTGDSGAPVLQQQGTDLSVVGVVSWSTGPGNSAGCGGLTGVTPLTLYRDWIVRTARSFGAALP